MLKNRNKVRAEFNMSSMTDLVFLLLIFFIILSTMVKNNTVMDMNLPKSTSDKKAKSPLVVSLNTDMVYKINNQEVPSDQVLSSIQQMAPLEENPEQRVEIALDEMVPHKYFVELVDLISVQGGYKISIQTSPK